MFLRPRLQGQSGLCASVPFNFVWRFTSVRCPRRMLARVMKKFQGTLFYSFWMRFFANRGIYRQQARTAGASLDNVCVTQPIPPGAWDSLRWRPEVPSSRRGYLCKLAPLTLQYFFSCYGIVPFVSVDGQHVTFSKRSPFSAFLLILATYA